MWRRNLQLGEYAPKRSGASLSKAPMSKPEPIVMLPVPGGVFLMGSSDVALEGLAKRDSDAKLWLEKGCFEREQPAHEVTLRRFLIAKLPVTVCAFGRFIADGGYTDRACWTHDGWTWREAESREVPAGWKKQLEHPMRPVVGVSWFEAIAYSLWSTQNGLPARLPSEAEWERAARGDSNATYPWGMDLDAERFNARPRGVGLLDVGEDSPAGDSEFGVSELIGNVSEWTSSAFREYPYQPNDGREAIPGTALRTTRGGSWRSPALRCRATARGYNDPWFSDDDLGFRLAADSPSGP